MYLSYNLIYVQSVLKIVCCKPPLPRQYDIFGPLRNDQCVIGRQDRFSHWYDLLVYCLRWPNLTDIEQERARASDWQLRNYLRREELKLLTWTSSPRPLEIAIPKLNT